MADITKYKGITMTVSPVLTIDDSTAYTILGLLELYCRANALTVDVSRQLDGDIVLNLVSDKAEAEETHTELCMGCSDCKNRWLPCCDECDPPFSNYWEAIEDDN